ncbi:ComF family protein [Polynucleobacter antarcticus]|nr:ComF family protein [Polynucleobacter antarcticus]
MSEQLLHYECCPQCGITLASDELDQKRCQDCTIHPPYFDRTYCLDRYDGKLQSALHQLKYQHRLASAYGLACVWNQLLSGSLKKLAADYLLPVPLSEEKLHARGFNQSWELARRIECDATIQKNPYALMRHHHSQHQANENRSNRHTAVQNMFYVNPIYCESFRAKTVIVFDDVMTSGATLNEIARILKDNGAYKVINWVLLRTLRPMKMNEHKI